MKIYCPECGKLPQEHSDYSCSMRWDGLLREWYPVDIPVQKVN